MPRPDSPKLQQPARERQASHNDLESFDNDKEWERLLRAAKAEQRRKDAELAQARAEKAELTQRLSQVGLAPPVPPTPPAGVPPPAPAPTVEVDTGDPKALRFRSRWFSVIVPVGWITAALGVIGTPVGLIVQHFVTLEREVVALRQVVVGLQTEVAELRKATPPPAPKPPR